MVIYHQVLHTVYNRICYAYIQPATQLCLHQHHNKHMNNVLHCDLKMAMMSLGNRNFSPLIKSYGITIIYEVCL